MRLGKRRAVSKTYSGVLLTVIATTALVTYAWTVQISQSNPNALQLRALANSLERENAALRNQLAGLTSPTNSTFIGLDPVTIYQEASPSVVTVQGVQVSTLGNSTVLGSGFVIDFQGNRVVTNYHVVHNVADLTVTFPNGDSYQATVVGTDAYVDLAVLSVNAPASEFHPLRLGTSSLLRVGEPVVAIGNPFGLSGSETFGIVSQLGRTLSESLAGSFTIANVIQFSAPINPGNSGGPLLNANGTVVGITTAVVASSQGVGFAIPSDVIVRELPSLITTGTFIFHSFMGISGVDMTYQLSKIVGTNVTYGVLVQNLTIDGPAAKAGLRGGSRTVTVQGSQYSVGGDLIIAISGTRIVGLDVLSAYLQDATLPGQVISVQVIRDSQLMTLNVTLGTRPPPRSP